MGGRFNLECLSWREIIIEMFPSKEMIVGSRQKNLILNVSVKKRNTALVEREMDGEVLLQFITELLLKNK